VLGCGKVFGIFFAHALGYFSNCTAGRPFTFLCGMYHAHKFLLFFADSFFRNGFRPSGVLEHPTELSDVAFNRLKKDFERQYSGAMNTGKPIIAEGGMKWHQLSISPQDAQYIQSKEFTLSEIARWFGVKQYKLGLQARETHSNIFQNAQEHIDETLHPWAVKWEMEARRKLFKPEDRQRFYTKYDFRGLLRGDHASRTAYYTAMLDRGVYSINDVRALEDENPIENGDARFVPLNTTTLERAISGEVKQDPKQTDE
jgi:HK97 family phage portal protein